LSGWDDFDSDGLLR